MRTKLTAVSIGGAIAAIGLAAVGCDQGNGNAAQTEGKVVSAAASPPATEKAQPQGGGKGLAAMDAAAKAGKYLFVFFYKEQDEQTRAMRKVFDAASKKVAGRADAIAINVADASEKGIVEKLGVGRAPMPFVLVLASNGAVAAGFPREFDEKQLAEAFVSPGMERCLKALQERKLVFVCVQNGQEKQRQAAMQGVRGFKADARFAKTTEIVALDLTDAAEAKFLQKLKVDPKTGEAVTVFLAPTAGVIGKFKGATSKDKLVAALESAKSGAGSSCCPDSSGGG